MHAVVQLLFIRRVRVGVPGGTWVVFCQERTHWDMHDWSEWGCRGAQDGFLKGLYLKNIIWGEGSHKLHTWILQSEFFSTFHFEMSFLFLTLLIGTWGGFRKRKESERKGCKKVFEMECVGHSNTVGQTNVFSCDFSATRPTPKWLLHFFPYIRLELSSYIACPWLLWPSLTQEC